jgi:hypothetical protein
MTKKAILVLALAGLLSTAGSALASLTGAKGNADRIALREGYSQYEGKIDLRDSTGAVPSRLPPERPRGLARLQRRREQLRHEPVLGRRHPGLVMLATPPR